MTRIIAGRAGGRRLATPRGTATRPTSDRVREALFSAIESWCGSLEGLRVLDLYAGSGAVGLEAWSRGAAAVTLVEHDRATAALIRDNAKAIGCQVATVVTGAAATVLATPPREGFDVVYADPPYPLADDALAADLIALTHGWLAPEALVIVERSKRSAEPGWPEGIDGARARKYGETTLWYGHATAQPPA